MTYVNVNGSVSMTSPARDVAPATYTISELAAEFDITPRAIRFYEDMGLLNPARDGRNRVYSVRDRTRLKLTLRGKRLGLSLQEIRQLVDMYESPSDTVQQLTAFLAILQAHRERADILQRAFVTRLVGFAAGQGQLQVGHRGFSDGEAPWSLRGRATTSPRTINRPGCP